MYTVAMNEPKPQPERKATPFDQLTPEQREKGRKFLSEITIDKITLSFSIEDRDAEGRKKSAFYSISSSRGPSPGYTLEETQLARTYLARHVVQATYDDAFRRKILTHSQDNVRERDAILAAYDDKLVHMLANPEPTK